MLEVCNPARAVLSYLVYQKHIITTGYVLMVFHASDLLKYTFTDGHIGAIGNVICSSFNAIGNDLCHAQEIYDLKGTIL